MKAIILIAAVMLIMMIIAGESSEAIDFSDPEVIKPGRKFIMVLPKLFA